MAEPPRKRPKRSRISASPYMIFVGVAFVVLVAYAGINTLCTNEGGALGVGTNGAGDPLPEFAIPDARSDLTGDANIAQDDCETSTRPCPESDDRTPACKVELPGAVRACDYFDKPLVLSFWFTRGGDCEAEQDVFEGAYRRFNGRVNFLGIDVRDSRDTVRKLIAERGWTHPVGLDSDGALSNLYRIGGCPTFIYVYPGGIVQGTSIGEIDLAGITAKVDNLITASAKRAQE